MAVSYITEKALAQALKQLMQEKSINRIRIQEITDVCHMTRHTFYNHFKDIYDLLGWIYKNEIIEDLDHYCHLDTWKEGIMHVLSYTLDNRILCMNTYRSLGREHLEDFLYGVFCHMLRGVMSDIEVKIGANEELKEEAADFYANAFVGLFTAWLKDGLRESPESFANRIDKMLEGNLLALFERYR